MENNQQIVSQNNNCNAEQTRQWADDIETDLKLKTFVIGVVSRNLNIAPENVILNSVTFVWDNQVRKDSRRLLYRGDEIGFISYCAPAETFVFYY